MKRLMMTALVAFAITALPVQAARYVIDTDKAHAFIQFKISHLGYSYVMGRFNDFNGEFTYDEKNPSAASITVDIDASSIDSNHAERDKHLRSKDFLHTDKFKTARFVSTSFRELGDGKAELKGDLTLRGVTKPVTIDVTHNGAGLDPWGGYRRGFNGTTTLTLKDFGIEFDLGPVARTVEMELTLEGIRQQ